MVFRGWKWWYASLNGCWMRPPLAPLSDCSQWLNLNNVWMWGCICTLDSFVWKKGFVCLCIQTSMNMETHHVWLMWNRLWIQCCLQCNADFTQTDTHTYTPVFADDLSLSKFGTHQVHWKKTTLAHLEGKIPAQLQNGRSQSGKGKIPKPRGHAKWICGFSATLQAHGGVFTASQTVSDTPALQQTALLVQMQMFQSHWLSWGTSGKQMLVLWWE